jgi:outer membrane receptor for ferric coprogen and ferric-rhodotorulic acid
MQKPNTKHAICLVLISTLSVTAHSQDKAINAENTEELSTMTVLGNEDIEQSEHSDSYILNASKGATGLNLSQIETPQSVSIITHQLMKDMDLSDISDVVNFATGVSSKAYDSSRNGFSARGFDITNIMIDGVPFSWSSGWSAGESQTSLEFYDRVEVVRGATGLLTGAGEPSASINLVRKKADSQVYKASISTTLGSWNHYGGTLDINTPLTESGKVRGRFIADYKQEDSFISLLEDKTTALYGVVEADLSDDSTLSVGMSYQNNEPTASLWGGLPTWYNDGTRTDWARSTTIGADWTKWASKNTNYFARFMQSLGNNWELDVRFDRLENTANMRLIYLSGTVDKATGAGLSASPRRYDVDRAQDTISAQITGKFDLFGHTHDLVIGAVKSDQELVTHAYDRGTFDAAPNFYGWDGSYDQPEWSNKRVGDTQDTSQTGYYAVTRLTLTDSLKWILGARLSNWETDGVNWQGAYKYDEDNVLTPYSGLIYGINSSHSAYVSYSEIFNPQNSLDVNGDFLDPITGTNYEVGLKSEYLDGRVNTSAAIFRIEQENIAEVAGTNPTTSEAYYREVDGVVSKGYELEVTGEILPGWNLTAGWSQYTAKDADGDDANTRFPRKMFNLFSKYSFSGGLDGLSLGAGINWEDENFTISSNPLTSQEEKLEQSSYTLVKLMASYEFNNKLRARLNVNNALDKTYYSQIGFFNQLAYGKPRDAKVTIEYDL